MNETFMDTLQALSSESNKFTVGKISNWDFMLKLPFQKG